MKNHLEHQVLEQAGRQAWTIARHQALAIGLTDRMISGRLQSGRWRRVHDGVYTIEGPERPSAQRVWAAVLGAGKGVHVSHETAASLLGAPGFPIGRPVLTDVHGQHHRLDGVVVHQLSDVRPEHRTVDDSTGLPITTIARTIVDLAAVVHPSRLRFAIDELVASRAVDVHQIASCLADVARRGKPGVRVLARTLDARGPRQRRPPRSWLEREVERLIGAAGLPSPARQLRFPGRMDIDGCVDFAWTECRLILEADGRRWHSRIADLARDRERDNQAARAGWQTLRLLHESIAGDPDDCIRTLAEVYAQRARSAA